MDGVAVIMMGRAYIGGHRCHACERDEHNCPVVENLERCVHGLSDIEGADDC